MEVFHGASFLQYRTGMKDLLRQIHDMIVSRQMLEEREQVLVAVSGGADSVCLLLALKELGYGVRAVHVEHGIRGQESLEDCAFVQELCRKEEVPLEVHRIDAPALGAGSGRSVEEAARDARYRILMEAARRLEIRAVATAHHMDDQAETVLWNLMRGSSLAGLGGILPVRRAAYMPDVGGTHAAYMPDAGDTRTEAVPTGGGLQPAYSPAAVDSPAHKIRIIRPLLETGRDEIERWLTERGQNWREDRTNKDTEITRNAIRLQILPQMEKLNAGARRHIAMAAQDLAQARDYLEEVTLNAYRYAVRDEGNSGELLIDLRELASQPELIRRRILHRALGQAEGGLRDITREHVESLMRLAGMDNGRRISLPDGLRAVREEGVICLTRRTCVRIPDEVRIGGDGEYRFPGGIVLNTEFGIWKGGDVPKKKYTKTLAYDTIIPYITLRTRREGDWIQVNSLGGRRKLKDYLIDEKIPADRRDQIPLIAQGSHVLWVIGHRISEAAKVSEGAHFVRITVTGGTGMKEPRSG